jgi:hypothetical protein
VRSSARSAGEPLTSRANEVTPQGRLHRITSELATYYGLDAETRELLRYAVSTITDDAVAGSPGTPSPNFSDINGNGVPCQFSVSVGSPAPSLRFLGEVIKPGLPMPRRLALSSIRLQELLTLLELRSSSEAINGLFALLLPPDANDVLRWRMGIWFAITARPGAPIGLRVYLNQRWGEIPTRYERFARFFATFGRRNDLQRWSEIAPVVARAGIPFGIAFDILPAGIGQFKIYFANRNSSRHYWHMLLSSVGLAGAAPLVERFAGALHVEIDDAPPGAMSPSLEFTDDPEHVSLKIDVSCNQIGSTDRHIDESLMTFAGEIPISMNEYKAVLAAVHAGDLRGDRISSVQYCGLGLRAEEEIRLNVYLCPDVYT